MQGARLPGNAARKPRILAAGSLVAGTAAPLVQDIDMHLPANSLGLVYGKSGAGKSTLLYLLAGLLQPTHGSIVMSPAAAAAPSPAIQGVQSLATSMGLDGT